MYTIDIPFSFGSGATGLTLKAAVIGPTGSVVTANLTGFTEIGLGLYVWHGSLTDGQRGSVAVYTGNYTDTVPGAWNPLSNAIVLKGLEGLPCVNIIQAGIISSASFTVQSVVSGVGALLAATGILEKLAAVHWWFFGQKDSPSTSQIATNGFLNFYDGNNNPVGKQAVLDDGTSKQSIGAIQSS